MDKHVAQNRDKPVGDFDKYTFNVNIMFDDAFEKRKGLSNKVPNKWVNEFCRLVPDAAK